MRLNREEERYGYALITPSMVIVFGVIIIPIITTLIYKPLSPLLKVQAR